MVLCVVKYVEMEKQSKDVMMGTLKMEMVATINAKLKLGGSVIAVSSQHNVMSSVEMEGLFILRMEDAIRLNVMMAIFIVVMDALILAK